MGVGLEEDQQYLVRQLLTGDFYRFFKERLTCCGKGGTAVSSGTESSVELTASRPQLHLNLPVRADFSFQDPTPSN